MSSLTNLLQHLISLPSFSREENQTADAIAAFLEARDIPVERKGNNVWARNFYFSDKKPTLLLNSHHDTVKPNKGYTRDPFEPTIENGKLYGLGSNDAGGALVCLSGAFLHFHKNENLPFNIIYAATAEEEISGTGGIESILNDLGKIDFAIVGEPTLMKMAVAERGLMVLDAVAKGKAGHAARNEGINAIYLALKDIAWLQSFRFEKTSEWLGAVNMNVTVIQAGQAHNQIPEECRFTVDIRLNEHYTHDEVLSIIQQNTVSEITMRSSRIKPSFINMQHPMVKAAQDLNIELYGSPTTSDQALLTCPSVKIGPGDSARSHSADEFIFIEEIEKGLEGYCGLITACIKYF